MDSFSLDSYQIDDIMRQLRFTFLGQGRDRRTYLSPNKRYVLKFPKDEGGVEANQREASIWKEFGNKPDHGMGGACYAPCRLICGSILMMRAMAKIYGCTYGDEAGRNYLGGYEVHEDNSDESGLPYWACDPDNTDSYQVGQLPNGKFVVYDYG